MLLQGKPFALACAHTGFYPFSRDAFPALPQILLHHVGTINKRLLNLALLCGSSEDDTVLQDGMGVRMDINLH